MNQLNTRSPSFQNKPPTTFQSGDTVGIAMWIKSQQESMKDSSLVWGRIQDTGLNYVVEGYKGNGSLEWVRIPCRRLIDARLHLGSVMTKKAFQWLKELEDILDASGQ